MKILFAFGLAGLLGCASPGSRGPLVRDTGQAKEPERGLPAWVAVPAWMEHESARERYEVDGSRPTVSVVFQVCTWSPEPGMPVFPREGYAILGDAEANRIKEQLMAASSTNILTSPSVVAGLGQSSSVAITSPVEPRGGLVFFMSPTTIDEGGVDLRFSIQLAKALPEDQGNSVRLRLDTAKLEGRAKFGVGQSYVRAIERDNPQAAGTDMALFIQIARVDYPAEPVEETVAVLDAAHWSVD